MQKGAIRRKAKGESSDNKLIVGGSPFMYSPSGFSPVPEIGDVEVFVKNKEIHLFYLTLPNHDVIGHSVSLDGLTWKELPDALHTGDPGSCDDDMIWTMSVLAYENHYNMFYTALSKADQGQVQRIALATSGDLIHWKRYPKNPIGQASARWYETEPIRGMVSWRDPYPILEQGALYLLVCARKKSGPISRRGCVGLMSHHNHGGWKVEAPLYAPTHYMDWEVPVLLKLHGRYYLFGSIIETSCCHYRMAGRFRGPYYTPPNDRILPEGNYANRVCMWKGTYLMFHWLETNPDWDKTISRYRKLAPPKEIIVENDGTLSLKPFEGWSSKYIEPRVCLPPKSFLKKGKSINGRWEANEEGIKYQSTNSMSMFLLGQEEENFILDVTVRIEQGIAAGIVFRADHSSDEAMFLRLSLVENEIQLVKLVKKEKRWGCPWIERTVIQSGKVFLPIGEEYKLHLIASHEYIEVSVNGRVTLSALSWVRKQGRIGIFAEYGRGSFKDFHWQRI
jgi:beta-fructofuranosidase